MPTPSTCLITSWAFGATLKHTSTAEAPVCAGNICMKARTDTHSALVDPRVIQQKGLQVHNASGAKWVQLNKKCSYRNAAWEHLVRTWHLAGKPIYYYYYEYYHYD